MEWNPEPLQIKPLPGSLEAWLYTNKRSIEVFIYYERGKMPVAAKITARQLEKIIGKKI